jgi:hypothetical protein
MTGTHALATNAHERPSTDHNYAQLPDQLTSSTQRTSKHWTSWRTYELSLAQATLIR